MRLTLPRQTRYIPRFPSCHPECNSPLGFPAFLSGKPGHRRDSSGFFPACEVFQQVGGGLLHVTVLARWKCVEVLFVLAERALRIKVVAH